MFLREYLVCALLLIANDTDAFVSTSTCNPIRHRFHVTSFAGSPRDTTQTAEDDFDSDLLGVYVDGFPLPPTPVRDNDDELLADIRRIPVTPIGTPPAPGTISSTRPLRVIIAGGGLGGLALASVCVKRGFDVHIFEQAQQYKVRRLLTLCDALSVPQCRCS